MKSADRKTAVIKSLRPDEKVREVSLLGFGKLSFVQHAGVLIVDLPEQRDTEYPNALKIEFL